jgi:hypothetical protein
VKVGDHVEGGSSILAYLPQRSALTAVGSASSERAH